MNDRSANPLGCEQVLAVLWAFLDHELDTEHATHVHAHVEQCSPCGGEVLVRMSVKGLVSRSCACSPAPSELRVSIVTSIRQIQITRGGLAEDF